MSSEAEVTVRDEELFSLFKALSSDRNTTLAKLAVQVWKVNIYMTSKPAIDGLVAVSSPLAETKVFLAHQLTRIRTSYIMHSSIGI
jgi:hypothetical protein